jgi:hypothetical protein
MGQEIGPARGELAQLLHRGVALGFGQLTPFRMALRRAMELGDKDAVSHRAYFDHAF